jgi:predicted O-linked N-acetylglucosamine transferase (SPINDLY family)
MGKRLGLFHIQWLKSHDKDRFKIYCYDIGDRINEKSNAYKLHSDVYYYFGHNFAATCEKIIQDELDILIILDIGLDLIYAPLSFLRLAPVQCTTWAHPITTGSPTIDYFLSSELMEPENGQEHYSETLIRLPNLGIAYPKPTLPKDSKKRADFQLKEHSVIYLCIQTLFKYLPQYDYIIPSIAQRVPQAQFVFIVSYISEQITQKFQRRLQRAFAKFNLNSDDFCVMSPRLIEADYLHLNLLGDIFLDTFAWSGGVTTLKAIACNLPVVTCPGEFMRGRHSYGILRMLGVTDTIAQDEREYIDIAVRLGLDTQWRQEIRDKIQANHSRVYDDLTCVTALEEFYERVVNERSPHNGVIL